MDNKDYEYIQKEFKRQKEENMNPVKITKQLIDGLLNKYNACQYAELWYDSEIDDEDRVIYNRKFTDDEWKEYKINFDSRSSNSWVDEFDVGIWGLTNSRIRKMIRNDLNDLKKYQYTHPNDIRFYINKTEKGSNIYFYGRDLPSQRDYWFSFYNKEVTRCLTCKKDSCWRSKVCGEKSTH
jgi:hypothetical protein